MNQRTRDSVDEEAQITDVAVPRKTVDPDETIDDRLTDNVLNRIGPARYFQRDENGDPVETWHDVFDRVASNIADAEYEFGGDEALRNEWKGKFETAMREQRFIPNTPTISSAGTELQMLSACIAGNSPVYTRDGLKPMADVEVGDEVLTHEGRFMPVTAHWSNGVKETVDVKYGGHGGNYDVTATGDHEFLNQDGEWVELDDLESPAHPSLPSEESFPERISMVEYTSRLSERKQEKEVVSDGGLVKLKNMSNYSDRDFDGQMSQPSAVVENTDDLGWLFGLFMAEGDVYGSDVRFTLGSHETELADRMISVAEDTFDCPVSISESSHGNWIQYRISSAFVADLFVTQLGTGVAEKRIPEWIGRAPESYRESFLQGVLDGDGHRKESSDKLALANPTLVYECSLLARSVGRDVSFKLDKRREISSNDTSEVLISDSKDSDRMGLKTTAGDSVEVFDMEVAGDHSFAVGDFIVHNCFVLSPGDSMEDILDTVKAWGLVEADGGGMGGAFYRLRPKGALVSSTGGTSSGPMPFIEMYDAAGGSIKQGSIRSGAQMAIMHAHHADVGRFIVSKRTEGDLDNFNISVAVTDEFIDAVRNDESYTFYTCDSLGPSGKKEPQEVLPETAHFYDPEFEDAWNDERNTPGVGLDGKVVEENLWRDYDIEGIEQYRDQIDLEVGEPLELPARFIWSMMMDGAWKNGEPGVYHIDEANREHTFDVGEHPENFQYATNPCAEQMLTEGEACLHGDELVSTENGITRIEDYSGSGIVTSDTRRDFVDTESQLIPQGKRNVVSVELDGGLEITATPDHEFITPDGPVEAQDLVVGEDSVIWMGNNVATPPVDMSDDDAWRAFTIGWMHGDGWMTENSIGISFNKEDGDFEFKERVLEEYHSLFGERSPLKDDETSYQEQTDANHAFDVADEYGFNYSRATERTLPDWFYTDASQNEQLAFLRGLFTADAGVSGKANSMVKYATSSHELVDELQSVLGALGIQTRSYCTSFSDRNDQLRVQISKESARKFMDIIGFESSQKANEFEYDPDMSYSDTDTLTVQSVSDSGRAEVYDLNVPSTNKFYTNGALVHNCNLGHVNLSLMVDENAPQFDAFASRDGISGDTERVVNAYLNRALNHEQFEDTIKTGTRFLDNVVTQSEFPLDEISEQVENKRKIGLGLMGFAQMLVQMGIPYGSDESYAVAREIMRRIDKTATEYSHELAKVRGPFPDWDDSKWADPSEHADWFRKHGHADPSDVDSNGYLMRNHSQTTIAPTGTTSRVANTTGGCEPIYNTIFFKNVSEDIQGDEMLVVMDDFLERVLEANDIDPDYVEDEAVRLMKDDSFDTISDVDVVPESIDDLFTTTEELSLREHIEMQVEFQKHCSSGISKTGNAPFDATRDDISDALLYGLENGVKGTTVYRQGSRKEQVNTTSLTNKEFDDDEIEELVEDAQLLASIQPDDAESLVETIEDELDNGGEN